MANLEVVVLGLPVRVEVHGVGLKQRLELQNMAGATVLYLKKLRGRVPILQVSEVFGDPFIEPCQGCTLYHSGERVPNLLPAPSCKRLVFIVSLDEDRGGIVVRVRTPTY